MSNPFSVMEVGDVLLIRWQALPDAGIPLDDPELCIVVAEVDEDGDFYVINYSDKNDTYYIDARNIVTNVSRQIDLMVSI